MGTTTVLIRKKNQMKDETLSEIKRRIEINEGVRLTPYRDSMGILTVGVGYNLEQGGSLDYLKRVGVADCLGVLDGKKSITQDQADALFDLILPTYISNASKSLDPGIFDSLSPARQFVIVDLEYNLGQRGWLGFAASRALINEAQANKNSGKSDQAMRLFGLVADHLRASAWDAQVHDRARRDEAMMRTSVWCNPYGNGSDIL